MPARATTCSEASDLPGDSCLSSDDGDLKRSGRAEAEWPSPKISRWPFVSGALSTPEQTIGSSRPTAPRPGRDPNSTGYPHKDGLPRPHSEGNCSPAEHQKECSAGVHAAT